MQGAVMKTVYSDVNDPSRLTTDHSVDLLMLVQVNESIMIRVMKVPHSVHVIPHVAFRDFGDPG